MATISLCMIVRNEEAVLARCLDSVREAADEIIIADTGSTDATKEIAGRYTGKVFDFEWIDDFSAARNFAYDQAAMDYQMWLDADDVLPPEELEKLLALKASLAPDTDMVTMKYHAHFDEKGLPVLTATRERLTRRSRGYRWREPVHECIPLEGNILHSGITVWHQKPPGEGDSVRNLGIYEKLEASGARLGARAIYYFARELKDHRQFAKSAHYFRRFLDEGEGWSEDNIAACYSLALCHTALGETEKALPALLRAFGFGGPRAEICAEIGYCFKRKGELQTALEWFRMATGLERPDSIGFILNDYWGYIPNMECCVCCCGLGQYEKAREYNKAAAAFRPGDAAVAHNEQYLAGILGTGGLS